MSDPFAFLNPIPSTKTAAQQVLEKSHGSVAAKAPPAPVAPLHGALAMGGSSPAGYNSGAGNAAMFAPQAYHGNGVVGAYPVAPGYGMSQQQNPFDQHQQYPFNQQQQNSFGQPQNPFGQQQAMQYQGAFQQQQQQPVMYDSIKKLLEQKPKVATPPADSASMDFLEGLGSGTKTGDGSFGVSSSTREPEPVGSSGVATGIATGITGDLGLDFAYLDASSSATKLGPIDASGTPKSNALASRLSGGKRPTQEMARKSLGFNAGSFTGASNSPRISVKAIAADSDSTKPQRVVSAPTTVDEFVAGGTELAVTDSGAVATAASRRGGTEPEQGDAFW